MKRLCLLLSVLFSVSAVSPTLAADCDKQVTFRRATSKSLLQGSITGYGACDYAFTARKGQKLVVRVDSRRIETHLVSPVEHMIADNDPFVLPQDGRYVLRVLAPRAFARKQTAIAYKMTLEIR